MTNWMAGFADLLMPDPAAQTAIDETLKDYRDERAQASSTVARLWTDVQCLAALGRVLTLTALRDLAVSDTWRVVGSCLLLSAAMVPFVLFLTSYGSYLLVYPAGIGYLLVQVAVFVFGPVAALGWFERADRQTRILGPAVASALLMLVMVGWVIPSVSEAVQIAIFDGNVHAAMGRLSYSSPLDPIPKELDATAVMLRLRFDFVNLRFVHSTGFGAALILAAPTGLLLGAAIRRRWRDRITWRCLQASGFVATVAIFALSGLLGVRVWSGFSSLEGSISFLLIGLWFPLVIAWIATMMLVRRRGA